MLLFLMLLAHGATPESSGAPVRCPGYTTIEVNHCLGEQLGAAAKMLERYNAAALARLRDVSKEADAEPGSAELPAMFQASARSWAEYREHECGAVYVSWGGGSIRTAAELRCKLALTQRRTHTVWNNWLRYADRSPPILPEPEMAKGE